MKKYILLFACMLFGLISCQKEIEPADPYVQFPIKSLVVVMDGANDDITAKPKVNDDGSLSNILSLPTFKDWTSFTVKTLILAGPDMTASIEEGKKYAFDENDSYEFTLTDGGAESKFVLWLDYPREPEPEPETDEYKWLVIKGPDGVLADGKIHEDASTKLMRTEPANAQCSTYEAYADLTRYSSASLGLASEDKSAGLEYAGNENLSASYFSVTMTDKAFDGDVLNTAGPSAAYDGVYKLNFDDKTKEFSALKTNWTINGTSTENIAKTMTWDAEKRVFTLQAELKAGIFKFITEPVASGDPKVLYGQGAGMGGLSTSGESIAVAADAEYVITLDLFSTPYKYTLEKVGGDTPGPAGAYMYVITYRDYAEANASSPRLFDPDGDGVYEGHVCLDQDVRNGMPIALVNESLANYYSSRKVATVPEGGYAEMTFYEGTYLGTYLDPNGAYCPWGQWAYSNGVWMIRYDSATMDCFIIQTDWHVNGTATGNTDVAMTYSAADNTWSITGEFAAGDFKFVTLPGDGVTGADSGEGTPLPDKKNLVYGFSTEGVLVENGSAISIAEAGTYTIKLDLRDPAGYKYAVLKDGEEPGPDPDADFVYVVFKGDGNEGQTTPESPKLYEISENIFSGDIDLTGHSWQNLGIVLSDLSKGFEHEHTAALPADTFTVVMTEKEVIGGACNTGGPWGDWNGTYSMTFNLNTKELTVTKK